jgi:hypothetical protein
MTESFHQGDILSGVNTANVRYRADNSMAQRMFRVTSFCICDDFIYGA